VLKKLL